MPIGKFISLLSTLGLATRLVNGQLEPDCNPLHTDCPAKKAWPEENYYIDFTKETGPPKNWIIANNEVVNFTPQGAEFTYGKRGDAPNMWTDFYMLGGRYDVELQIAPGQGIISSSVLWSDIQDEIDWEFSGNQHGEKPFPPPDGKWTVETNIFAQGKMWDGAATYQKDAYNPTTQFHTYSVEWDENHMNWYVDNQVVRSAQASNTPAGFIFPQSPMKLQLGVWGGGDPSNNYWTIQWAGGEIDMKSVPYTMYVRSVNITNKYPACQYKYQDRSGKITSIDKIRDGCSSSSVSASAITTLPETIKDNPGAETLTPVKSMGIYPTSIVSEPSIAGNASSSSPSVSSPVYSVSDTVTSQTISASSAPPSELTPSAIASSYPAASSHSSGPSVSNTTKIQPTIPSSAASSELTPPSVVGSYPVAPSSSTGGILSSLSSLLLGTSSGAVYSGTSSMPGFYGTYPATLTTASVSASKVSDSSSIGVTTPAIATSSTESLTAGNKSSTIGDITMSTISTVYSTNIYTITSCPATVKNCPVGQITTELISLTTTLCPVTGASGSGSVTTSGLTSSSPAPSGTLSASSARSSSPTMGSSSLSSFESYPSSTIFSNTSSETMPTTYTFSSEITTSFLSTVYSTNIITITSCAPTVKNCPVGKVTTETVSMYTTICPVTNTVIDGTTFSGQPSQVEGSTGLISSTISSSPTPISTQSTPSLVSSGSLTTNLVPSLGTSLSVIMSSVIYPNTTASARGSSLTVTQIPTNSPTSTPVELTTSTVYSTNVYTITSCAPTVTNCPARLGQVTTELVSLYTTICPVGQGGTTSLQKSSDITIHTSASPVPSYSTVPLNSPVSSDLVLTTSTVYTSKVYTITACVPEDRECSSSIGVVATELVPIYTTVCPVKDQTTTPSSLTSTAVPKTSIESTPSFVNGASSTSAELPSSSSLTTSTSAPVYTTSTLYSTKVYTVMASPSVIPTTCSASSICAPSFILTTEVIAVSTTVCPVSDKTISAGVPSYTMTEIESTRQQETPASNVATSTASITHIETAHVTPSQGHQGENGQCICDPTISTVYATVTVAETTITSIKTVEPPFPSTYGTGTGGVPLGTGAPKRRWFRRDHAGHGHDHH